MDVRALHWVKLPAESPGLGYCVSLPGVAWVSEPRKANESGRFRAPLHSGRWPR